MSATRSKSERTRAHLTECALELFDAQGFEQTTIAQIAERAGVTQMTFFRHFAAKENVVLDDPYDPLIGAAVGAQPRALPLLHRVAEGIRAAWSDLPEPATDLVRRRVRVIARSGMLRGAVSRNNLTTEEIIAAQLIDDGADPMAAHAAAAATLAALSAALFEWSRRDSERLSTAIETALDTMTGGSARE
ncbi:TetR/AcrR family transcriptional regulator [Okibacterium endophyticum]